MTATCPHGFTRPLNGCKPCTDAYCAAVKPTTDSESANPKDQIMTTINTVNMRALRAAAMFASTDLTRPILGSVKMFDGLYLATDTYRLAMVSDERLTPVEVVKRAEAACREQTKALLVPATLIETAAKLKGGQFTRLRVAGGQAAFERYDDMHQDRVIASASDRLEDLGEWPRIEGLLAPSLTAPPAARQDVGFNADFLAGICKAAKQLQDDRKMATNVVFHGGEVNDGYVKPVFWSSVTNNGTLVVFIVPIRSERTWEAL